jgi:hypothetical protein
MTRTRAIAFFLESPNGDHGGRPMPRRDDIERPDRPKPSPAAATAPMRNQRG